MGSIPTTTYGFISLGQIGHSMAKNLRQKLPENCPIIVFDVNKEAVKRFLQEHARTKASSASSPKEVAEVTDIILISVPQAAHVKAVFLHPETGQLAATPGSRQRLFLKLSTIDVAASTEMASAVKSGGYGDFINAPCSGSAMGAEKGTLSFMIGCPSYLFPRVLEICKLIGTESSIFHCGELSAGLITKVLNNYLSSLTTLATAETINIVINASSSISFNTKVNNPVPGLTPKNAASNGYISGFSLELYLGVLELGYQEAQAISAKVTLGKQMVDAYRAAAEEPRYQGKDSKIIYKWLQGEDA